MAEYIERERAYENMVSEMFGTGFLERATNAIKDVPTADVQEVRHRHWYWYENKNLFNEDEFERGWKCSCCDNYPDHDNYMADDYENMPQLKYCPNCGARMDERATDICVGSRKE